MDFLRGKLQAPSGGVLYMCGVPGTGKTEVAKACLAMINQELKQKGATVPLRTAVLSCGAFAQEPKSIFAAAYDHLQSSSRQFYADRNDEVAYR